MKWDKREFGLTEEDRLFTVENKFGKKNVSKVMAELAKVERPTNQLLGAVVFLLRPSNFDDLHSLIKTANENPDSILRAAAVKEERG